MSDQARGNFIAGVNHHKEPGSKKPDFTGRLSIPGRDHEFAIAVWANKDKNDEPYFAGRMDGMPISVWVWGADRHRNPLISLNLGGQLLDADAHSCGPASNPGHSAAINVAAHQAHDIV